MTAYEDVLDWIATRPWWQQRALARIASGETIGEAAYEEIAKSLFKEPPAAPEGGWLASVTAPQSTNDDPVRILCVKGVSNVNRLAENQELTFAPEGLTVVYGNNGSGKSGYARILQSMVRARHRADILPDVFAESPGEQSGEVTFLVAETEYASSLGSTADPALGRVALYDEHCGDTYLNSEAEISYRPSAVQLLDDLSTVTAGVRRVIDGWKTEKGAPGAYPVVTDPGSAATFLRALTAKTTGAEIAAATSCPYNVDQKLSDQVEEVARLRTADPGQEKQKLIRTADALNLVAGHLSGLDRSIGTAVHEKLKGLRESAKVAQEAADAASMTTFGDEPLAGIGSPVWKALWQAAENYSLVVYPEHDFPHADDGAVCVLCQQSLDGGGRERLKRFHEFVSETTAKDAESAKKKLEAFLASLGRQPVESQPVAVAIAAVEQSEPGFAARVQTLFDAFRARQAAMIADEQPAGISVAAEVTALAAQAKGLRDQAGSIDAADFAGRLAQAQTEENRLRDQIAMRDGKPLIESERARLLELAVLNDKFSETNTRAITDKVGELTKKYVTEEARDRFTRETDRLELERVTFKATRSRQGMGLLHKADFLNARAGARLGDVLSEGEQTALGFAGFLTEVHFDTSKSALVFDDPVSSLDHMRREAVANRIVDLAGERQVIVFTHDIAFTMVLRKTAEAADVPFATRGIERKRKIGPGFTTLKHPWTAQDAAQRVDTLRQEVSSLRRDEEGMSDPDYQRATEEIAGHMSQTWERIISQVLAEPLVDYRALEVRVGKLRVIGRVTPDDIKTYDDSYSRISGWASRHDPHPELNYTPPSVDTLTAEIVVLDTWLKSVKKYQSS
ncbi:AAA domain-containing protein [Arthrobacter sp. cf158]|uniref:AAA family ATPase n=1 Tax=Arthrobacter sp. cf158 TaxID=1761744 RepID=UPI000895DB69|nr:AAA family ATPase [Arthrobacter sp. cf158]SDW74491.1 AAA domain-containing protein [Arthrobacter sp. cf158]